MYLLAETALLVIGIMLLTGAYNSSGSIRAVTCAGRKSQTRYRTAIVMAAAGILLIAMSLGMFFLVLSGRIILPLK